MIKMIVTSFYNALINEDEAIPLSTMLEIERIRSKGILFCICTNRLYKEVLDYNKDFPFIDYIISLNGSYIYDVKKERALFKNKITLPNIKKISKIFLNKDIYYYTEEKVYMKLEEIEEKQVFKIEIDITDEKELEKKIKKIKENISIFENNKKRYLEITSNKSSMFQGVDKISLKNNISLKEIVAIGANDSDCSLIQNIPNHYIINNSCESIKSISSRKNIINYKKGVEKILKNY